MSPKSRYKRVAVKNSIVIMLLLHHSFSQEADLATPNNIAVNGAFITLYGYASKGAKLERHTCRSMLQCGHLCLKNPQCFSLNYQDSTALCELSEEGIASEEEREKLKEMPGFVFVQTVRKDLTPCMNHPCQNGGTCFPIYARDDHTCVCVPEYTGRHCEKKQTKTITICENKKNNISCSDGGKIDVAFANFGRLDNHTCPHDKHDYQSQTDCSASTSLDRVQTHCQNKTHCYLESTVSFFSEDPCRDIYKYLLVKYKCEH